MPTQEHVLATSYGKCPSGDIGGTIKQEAIRTSLMRPYKDNSQTPDVLFEFLRSDLKGINIDLISTEELTEETSSLSERFESRQ